MYPRGVADIPYSYVPSPTTSFARPFLGRVAPALTYTRSPGRSRSSPRAMRHTSPNLSRSSRRGWTRPSRRRRVPLLPHRLPAQWRRGFTYIIVRIAFIYILFHTCSYIRRSMHEEFVTRKHTTGRIIICTSAPLAVGRTLREPNACSPLSGENDCVLFACLL